MIQWNLCNNTASDISNHAFNTFISEYNKLYYRGFENKCETEHPLWLPENLSWFMRSVMLDIFLVHDACSRKMLIFSLANTAIHMRLVWVRAEQKLLDIKDTSVDRARASVIKSEKNEFKHFLRKRTSFTNRVEW